MAAQLKIAIVGAGSVGKQVGKAVSRKHLVTYGARDPAKYADLAGTNITVKTVPEAIKWADVVLLAVPGQHTDEGIKATAASLGPEIKGKVLVDATVPFSAYPALEVRWGQAKSAGEVLQEALPDTFVYKAFCTVGNELMDQTKPENHIGGQVLTMLYAGGPQHRDWVDSFIAATGSKPVYVGPIRYARNLEAIGELWCHLVPIAPGMTNSTEKLGRNIHFQLLQK